MPRPINPNRPIGLAYKHGLESGAAYRPSVTLKEAANMIKTSSQGVALKKAGWKFTSILKDIIVKKRRLRSQFSSNPWVGNINISSDASCKEYTVEDQIWRLVSYSIKPKPSAWFLAKHKGANNGFEFWHISNTAGLAGVKQPAAQQGAIAAPVFDLVDDHYGETVEIPTIVMPIANPGAEYDDWETALDNGAFD